MYSPFERTIYFFYYDKSDYLTSIANVLWFLGLENMKNLDHQSSIYVQKNKTNDLLILFQNSTWFGFNLELRL